MFKPHGFGPPKLMRDASSRCRERCPRRILLMPEPLYFCGRWTAPLQRRHHGGREAAGRTAETLPDLSAARPVTDWPAPATAIVFMSPERPSPNRAEILVTSGKMKESGGFSPPSSGIRFRGDRSRGLLAAEAYGTLR